MAMYEKDVFVECMVKKKLGTKDYLIFLGLFIIAFTMIFLSIGFLPTVGQFGPMIMIVAGAVFGLFYVIGLRNVEFEYAVTNGDVVIDKIINKKNRKRLMSFECKSIEAMGKYDELKQSDIEIKRKIFACKDDEGKDAVYVLASSKKYGDSLLVFNPNDKVLDAMKPYVPRAVKIEFYKK